MQAFFGSHRRTLPMLEWMSHMLEVMTDPVARSVVNAPIEDEEITPETAAALDAARASLDRGQGVPHEEILRQFGGH